MSALAGGAAHTPTPRGAGTLAVYFGNETVGVYPKDAVRNSARNVVIGPLPRTPESIERCQAVVAAANGDACTAHSALLTRVSELEAGLKKCVAQFEDMDEAMPYVDAGCIQCTAGTVPNHRNTGLCGYHAAKGLLEPRT